MRSFRRHISLLLALLACSAVRGVSLDSLMNLPVIGAPLINYSPETNWVFGAGIQGYVLLPEAEKTSVLQLDGAWSMKHQWYINAHANLYIGGQTPLLLQVNGGYRDYPDTYYGIGNQPNDTTAHLARIGQTYQSQRGYAQVAALFELPMLWAIGPSAEWILEKTDLGSSRCHMWGVGVTAQYDSRDILYYPTRGLFFKAGLTYFEPALGSDTRMGRFDTDLRHYVHLGKGFIFTYQLRTQWAIGNDIPFQMLSSFGGQDLLRGVPHGMFRDNAMLALQTEMRLPIWNFIHACVFAGIGDVYNTAHWQWATPKVGYGLGLRIGINRAKINIRADVARSNIYTEWNSWRSYSFYLTATEAF
ncbi:MAG: BamA/TamA family outer membrane protein [Paludibacteraceae bacterium]|nr:BamA/TamA family outer membrane protein [Paludibacteraceae bacterium]